MKKILKLHILEMKPIMMNMRSITESIWYPGDGANSATISFAVSWLSWLLVSKWFFTKYPFCTSTCRNLAFWSSWDKYLVAWFILECLPILITFRSKMYFFVFFVNVKCTYVHIFPLQIYEHFVLQYSLTSDYPWFSLQLIRSRLLEQPHKHCSVRRYWYSLQRFFHRIPPQGFLYLWNHGWLQNRKWGWRVSKSRLVYDSMLHF